VLRCAPEGTSLVIDRVMFDEPTSALLVLTRVEAKRPDVRFFYRPGTLFEPVYGTDVLDLSWRNRFLRQKEVEKPLREQGETRCLALNQSNTPFDSPVLAGLLYKEREEREFNDQTTKSRILRRSFTTKDYSSRLMAVHIPYFLGKNAMESNNSEEMDRWFRTALEVGSDMAWLSSNIGSIYARLQRVKESERFFQLSARQDPYFYEAHYGLGFVALKYEKPDEAVRHLETAVKVAPHRPEGYYMLGVAASLAGDVSRTRSAWEEFLRLSPDDKLSAPIREELRNLKSG
jgi:tetratricopeptide (TPR) repeat protein